MKELELLKSLGARLDPPQPVPPPGLRHRALSRTGPVRAGRRRPIWRLAVAGGLAVAITGGLYLTGVLTPDHGHNGGGPGTRPGGDSEAAVILHNAALAARRQPASPVPRPDQFIFTETLAIQTAQTELPDGTMKTERTLERDRVWSSVDGTHDGLMRRRMESAPSIWASMPLDGCKNGKEDTGGGDLVDCTPAPAFRAELPTDANGMLHWLYANSNGDNPRDEQAFITAGDLLQGSWLTHDAQAALFEALAKLPGVTVRPDMTDLAGRHGVGIGMGHVDPSHPAAGRSPAPTDGFLIFDSTTFAFLGTGDGTLVRQAIVDRAGQLP